MHADDFHVRLNIGSSQTYLQGFGNVDIHPSADIVVDLSVDKLPMADDSVDLVFTYHTLEHIPDYLFALGEIHRVLRHGGVLLVGVPYATLTEYHMVNPYHLHDFNEHSFGFFDPARLKYSAGEQGAITFHEVFVRLNYFGGWSRLPRPMKSWARRHLLNVVRHMDAGLLAVKNGQPLDDVAAVDLISLYDTLLASRIPR